MNGLNNFTADSLRQLLPGMWHTPLIKKDFLYTKARDIGKRTSSEARSEGSPVDSQGSVDVTVLKIIKE